jgi:REP element-mobilizing transposase RayT
MRKNEEIQEKGSNLSHRLVDYNYCDPGWYYITICTDRHVWQFGNIVNGQVDLNEAGSIVQAVWESLPQRFPGIALDEYVIMPNHVHAILVLPEKYPFESYADKKDWRRPSVSTILRTFKGAATHRIRHTTSKTTFQWQPNYYDHIVRNDPDIDRIRLYIINNPAQWLEDQYYRKQ